ncbi:MAG: hypothetical protein CME71_11980 [Halobacteriovorax sp.]|nr:hypothetical protein [Halobacteriovorax sp.]|tara:strand:- start:732 stop:1673 length:942 start_codon:yes stop_codon:yes gene_type:complete
MKLSLILALLFSSHLLLAKDWKINDQHTQVQFNIGYMGVMEVAGTFTQTRGKFEFDEDSSIARNILFQIATKSIRTHNKKRDSHLRRPDFFDVKQFPWIEITLPQADLTPGSRQIQVLITMRGVQRQEQLQMQVEGLKSDPWDKTKRSLFLRVSGKIKRSDYGLSWNKDLDQGGVLVSDEVRVSIDIEANPSDQKLAFSRFYLPSNQGPKATLTKAMDLPENYDFDDEPEEQAAKKIDLAPKDATNPASFVIGFFIFISITITSIWLKIKLQKLMQKKMKWGNLKSEVLSDLILLAFVLSSFAMTAPLMGYGN